MSDVKISSGHEGNVREQVTAYFQRIKNGEMGALPAVGALVVVGAMFSILSPFFLTKLNFANLFVQAAELTMLAVALVFVILLGEIDLSAGVTAGVAMAAFFLLMQGGTNWIVALIVAFVVGGAIGALIGFFVARIGVPSFVVTLGLFLGFQGLQLVMLGEGGIFRIDVPEIKAIMNDNLPTWGGWAFLALMLVLSAAVSLWDRARRARHDLSNRPIELLYAKLAVFAILGGVTVYLLNENRSQGVISISGVPIVIPIAVLILFIGTLVLDRTQFGRHLYAVGGNAEAARRAGIKVANIRITAFIICSMLAVVSGLFHVSRLGAVEATAGRQIVLNGVAAAVVGGVSLFGGRGRLVHAAIGAFVIVMIENGLGLLEFPAGVNLVVTGSVLILAATIDALSRKRGNGVRS